MKAALEQADADLKDALEKEDADLKAALAAKDDALAEKDSALQTFITIVCVISGVTFLGGGAFVVWFFIDRKKRI